MKRWQAILVMFVIALVSAIGGYQLQQNLKKKNNVDPVQVQKQLSAEEVIGTEIAEFDLFDVHGERRFFSEWKGKLVVINFWATWCPPCREEIPHFVELQEHYSSDGLQFIGIALQEADEIQDFLAEFKVNYPSLVDNGDVTKLAKKLGNDIGALPYTVVIDRAGKIVFTKRGPLSKSETESVIQTFL